MLAIGTGGLLALDFHTTRKAAASGAAELTFRAYLDRLPARLASVTASSGTAPARSALADLLPRPPEGWAVRSAEKGDVDVFLPKRPRDADPDARKLVESVGSTRAAKGAEVTILTYERGERRVMVQLVRQPDRIFTDPAAFAQRHDLRVAALQPRGRAVMAVRGLDVTEEFLGDGMRGRFFSAAVGGQIQVRMLTSKRLKDSEVLAFLETLDVKGLNAAAADRQPGLGEVPVIVLASALGDADREAFETDRARRDAEAIAVADDRRQAEELAFAAAATATLDDTEATAAPEKPKAGFSTDCKKSDGGTRRCSVGSDG